MSDEAVEKRFELAVQKLQEDLQYLANQEKVSQSFLNRKNNIIRSLIDYYHHAQSKIASLEMELAEQQFQTAKFIKNQKEEKEKLEAVCLVHGITDVAYWMEKPLPLLIRYITEFYELGGCQLPLKWGERFSALPEELKEQVLKAMSYNYEQKAKTNNINNILEYAATQGNN